LIAARTPEPDDRPFVSVIVPMLNEADHIERCLTSLYAQDYAPDRFEILVVDGGSVDGSRERVQALARQAPDVRLIENPAQRASAAFNRGVEAAAGDVVCLVAAHAEVGTDYLRRSVDVLSETEAAGVGGVLKHEGLDRGSRAIGLAMTSPFGMASPFRYASSRRVADTIGHPAYWRERLEQVGPFDETLLRNSDYELNYRLRRAGAELLFDPTIVTTYRPRTSLPRLGRQFWAYGQWKAVVVRRHPRSVRPRHLAAPVAIAVLALAPALAASRTGRRMLVTAALAYGGLLAAAIVVARPTAKDADPVRFVAAFPTMHVAWGAGFWSTVLRGWRR
jgi:glycosyltransferase involved in cell wall biosynthesis